MTATTDPITDGVLDVGFDGTAMVSMTPPGLSSSPIISHDLRSHFFFANRVMIGQAFAVFGVLSNIANLAILYKMGFREPINISLFGLALSDFLSCVTMVWANVCHTPTFKELDLPISTWEVAFLTAGLPHIIFIKISGCITAYITFERCLCVTFPLKVKNIITPKRVTIFLVCAYVAVLGLYAPAYYLDRLAWKFYPRLNKTLIGVIFGKDSFGLESWLYPIRGVILPWFYFVSTVICTSILVVTLKKKSEWRKKATATTAISTTAAASSGSTQVASSRDAKVSTLVVFISTVFIACYIPNAVSSIAVMVEPELNVGRRYHNLVDVIFSFNFIFESINASLNIFIYYFRSSKYKATVDHILFKSKKTKKDRV